MVIVRWLPGTTDADTLLLETPITTSAAALVGRAYHPRMVKAEDRPLLVMHWVNMRLAVTRCSFRTLCQRSRLVLLSFASSSLSSLSPALVSADHDADLVKPTPFVTSLAASDRARAS